MLKLRIIEKIEKASRGSYGLHCTGYISLTLYFANEVLLKLGIASILLNITIYRPSVTLDCPIWTLQCDDHTTQWHIHRKYRLHFEMSKDWPVQGKTLLACCRQNQLARYQWHLS